MRQVVLDLIQAVRNLGLEATGEEGPKSVRISIKPQDFLMRLGDVQRALEAVDRDGSLATDAETLHPKDDPEKLKLALDGLMRLFQIKGGELQEATDVIQSALGLSDEQEERKRETFDTLPNFAPARLKRARPYRPRLRLLPEKSASISFDSLRRMNFEVLHVQSMLGATFRPQPVTKVEEADGLSPSTPKGG